MLRWNTVLLELASWSSLYFDGAHMRMRSKYCFVLLFVFSQHQYNTIHSTEIKGVEITRRQTTATYEVNLHIQKHRRLLVRKAKSK